MPKPMHKVEFFPLLNSLFKHKKDYYSVYRRTKGEMNPVIKKKK